MQEQRVSVFRPRSLPFQDGFRAREGWGGAVFALLRLSPASALSILAIASLPAPISVSAQQVQFSQGFSGAGQNGARSPAESNAYAAAVSQPNPAVRISAIEQFLKEYPGSSLRQQAVAQIVQARRQSQGGVAASPAAMAPAATPQPAPAPAVAPAPAPVPQTFVASPRNSLLQQPPKPAQVSVSPHSLTVKADNSALSQILHEISISTGMKVEGLSQDQRVFGSYGPGEPRVVLLSLLEGSGYNLVMIGDTPGGAPRELSLTQRTAGAASLASASIARNSSQDDDDADQDVQQTPPPPEPPQPLPGNPQNPEGAQPRSPQEIQQELLRLRQQQQQQQPPPNPQQ